ncbi:MAG: metallophosphoesterase [Myxococcota bacterium]
MRSRTPRRTLVVGDVHGCRRELEALLAEVAFEAGQDRLVLVGDLVAKGPDSLGAVQLARTLGADAVRGNHDARCLAWWQAARAGAEPPSLGAGHRAACASLDADAWAYLEAQPVLRRYEDVLEGRSLVVVHGGLDPLVDPDELAVEDPDLVMNARSLDAAGQLTTRGEGRPWGAAWAGPELVVFGHDAVRGLQQHPHALGLDTGCVYGGALTGALFEGGAEPSLHQVPAARVYCAPKVPRHG